MFNSRVNGVDLTDLQQVLTTPHSNVGEMYYLRNLNVYNFVINDQLNRAECYLWSEVEGKRVQ